MHGIVHSIRNARSTRCVLAAIALTAIIPSCTTSPAADLPALAALQPAIPGPVDSAPIGSAALPEVVVAPTPAVARKPRPAVVEPWFNGKRPGELITTDHFAVRTTLRNGDLRKFIPLFTERALAHYTSALCELPQPKGELETYIFGTRDEWVTFTNERLGADAPAYLGLGRGGYTSKATAILYDIGPTDTLTILAHEGWHQYSQAVLREELPVWLEEGISTYMEGYRVNPTNGDPVFSTWRNFERFGELREAVRREQLIPLESLLENSPQHFLSQGRDRLLVYYAQVWALTHYLHEGDGGIHKQALTRMLEDAINGKLGASLVAGASDPQERRSIERCIGRGGVRAVPGPFIARVFFGKDLAAMAAGYDEFVRRIVARGSGDAIWRGASPIKPK